MGIQQNLLGGGHSMDEIFSIDLYTGNAGSSTPDTQSIVNGIDLSSEGGLVWIKSRAVNGDHSFFDTSRGATKWLVGNNQSAQNTDVNTLTSFNSNGFSLGADNNYVNRDLVDYVAWTFRKQPKFFDIVEYQGANYQQTIPHNLGSVPGAMLIVEKNAYDSGYRWFYHQDMPNNTYIFWQDGQYNSISTNWLVIPPSSTEFVVPYNQWTNHTASRNYIAYLWADDEASEFSADGISPIIKCGHYYGSNDLVSRSHNLGFEPQFLIIKKQQNSQPFVVFDSTRGTDKYFNAGSSGTEQTLTGEVSFTSTGFDINPTSTTVISSLNNAGKYLYIAVAAP